MNEPETSERRLLSEESRNTIELISTVLLAIAALAAAWAGFQAAKWGGVQSTSFSEAGANRTESTRASTQAGQQAQVDIALFTDWLAALQDDIDADRVEAPATSADYEPTNGTLSGFLFQRFRPEFQPAVQAWLDAGPFGNPDAPATPFDMDEYVVAAAEEAEALRIAAEESSAEARDANQTSDDYVLTAVLFALALFFIAVAGKVRRTATSLATLALGVAVLVGTIARVVTLPIEI